MKRMHCRTHIVGALALTPADGSPAMLPSAPPTGLPIPLGSIDPIPAVGVNAPGLLPE